MAELERSIFTPFTKRYLLDIMEHMQKKNGIDDLILGCTELSLLLNPHDIHIPSFNTLAIHCHAIVKRIVGACRLCGYGVLPFLGMWIKTYRLDILASSLGP